MSKQKSEIVRRGYDRIAKRYHKQRDVYKSNALLRKFSKLVPKGSKVIDLGCGAGVPVAKFLANKGYKVVGIDFAEGMVKLAKKNVPEARFIKIDITKMKFGHNSFDGAVSFYALIHISREKHSEIYKSLHLILKPGSIILVNAGGSKAREYYEEDYLGVKMFWSFYGPKKCLSIIKNAGFSIIWSKLLRLGGERQFWVLAKNKK